MTAPNLNPGYFSFFAKSFAHTVRPQEPATGSGRKSSHAPHEVVYSDPIKRRSAADAADSIITATTSPRTDSPPYGGTFSSLTTMVNSPLPPKDISLQPVNPSDPVNALHLENRLNSAVQSRRRSYPSQPSDSEVRMEKSDMSLNPATVHEHSAAEQGAEIETSSPVTRVIKAVVDDPLGTVIPLESTPRRPRGRDGREVEQTRFGGEPNITAVYPLPLIVISDESPEPAVPIPIEGRRQPENTTLLPPFEITRPVPVPPRLTSRHRAPRRPELWPNTLPHQSEITHAKDGNERRDDDQPISLLTASNPEVLKKKKEEEGCKRDRKEEECKRDRKDEECKRDRKGYGRRRRRNGAYPLAEPAVDVDSKDQDQDQDQDQEVDDDDDDGRRHWHSGVMCGLLTAFGQ